MTVGKGPSGRSDRRGARNASVTLSWEELDWPSVEGTKTGSTTRTYWGSIPARMLSSSKRRCSIRIKGVLGGLGSQKTCVERV